MSLKIDPQKIRDKSLSKKEIKYLQARNRLPAGYFDEAEDDEFEQLPPTIGDEGGIDEEDDGEEDDYEDGWNNDQRRTELLRRKLSVHGRKDDLIARLRRSDLETLTKEDYSDLED